MARTRYRVVPSGSTWQLRREQERLSDYNYKYEAVEAGQRIARANPPSQLIIHNADGTIEKEYTYGDDPYPPKG
ncbi:DUF2188 domain-containing protein [Streptomyces sp. NBC_00620]|uniref:DUF2188 domain-containing protein n=1 Tax=Streptomyces sp. NBC_00620 TaxID=2903666 RepID=UPI00225B7E7F|nr:DUF2188 domain-containing protein [Streptomyces sp. NBC_00620]MCX4973187.1 DUF2188 domain-containing protein [Streptomyces sp. NBC_00620]